MKDLVKLIISAGLLYLVCVILKSHQGQPTPDMWVDLMVTLGAVALTAWAIIEPPVEED